MSGILRSPTPWAYDPLVDACRRRSRPDPQCPAGGPQCLVAPNYDPRAPPRGGTYSIIRWCDMYVVKAQMAISRKSHDNLTNNLTKPRLNVRPRTHTMCIVSPVTDATLPAMNYYCTRDISAAASPDDARALHYFGDVAEHIEIRADPANVADVLVSFDLTYDPGPGAGAPMPVATHAVLRPGEAMHWQAQRSHVLTWATGSPVTVTVIAASE